MGKISEGKLKGITAVAGSRGVIRAAAMDQRGSLQKALAKARGTPVDQISDPMMEEFKAAVIKVLSPYATGVLLDPEWGLPASRVRAPGVGLLLAYEQSGYDNTQPGRLPDLLPEWSVRRLVEAGADCIKILIYYTPFDSPGVNEIKHAFIERIGAECLALDVPFFLEFIGYDPTGKQLPLEYARRKPEIVSASMREFSKDRYGVDVLKVEVPVDFKFVPGSASFAGEEAYSREQARDHFLSAAEAAGKPFIYLSAGVSDEQFRETLRFALEAGVKFSGVLCGRATWQEAIPVYARQGVSALEEWLADRGVANIQALNQILEGARPWREFYGVGC